MSSQIRLEIGGKLPILQAGVQQWRVRAANRKMWHKRVAEYVMVNGLRPDKPWERVRVECVRYSSREPD